MGSVCSRDFEKTLKSEVSRSVFVASPLRCDPNRGQRRQHDAAASPRCDPMRGQRGKQDFNVAGKDLVRTSGLASTMASSTIGPSLAGAGLRTIASSTSSSLVGNLDSSRVAESKIRSAWRSPGFASALRSSSKCMSRRFAGSNTLGGKNMDGAGGSTSRRFAGSSAMCGKNMDGAAGSTSRSFADSSALSGKAGDLALNRQAGRKRVVSSGSATDFDSAFIPHARSFSLHPSLVSNNSCGAHGVGGTNSCGSVHGGVMHDNSSGMHVNSYGALGHKNSCHVHAAEVRRGTKALSTSTRFGVRCPAVEELASPQQAPGSLHEEVWASILQNQGPKIFREVEIIPGCAATVACPSCPDHSPEPPGPGRIIRNMLGWSLLEKNEVGCGVWLFRGALQGKNLFSSLDVTGDWVRKGSYHTAWAVPCNSSCACSYSYGQGPAVGPHTGRRCWPLLEGVWRAIAPLMKPWCAEGEVPTAANLNLYRGGNSCVGWHRDDELLFGESGEAKLIVSVSLGGSAVFRWKRRSCPDDEGHLCCLGHGDILVMDGRCQDKFLHRTDPCREQERINVTFRWIKQHVSSCPLFRTGVACCLPTCAQGLSVPVVGNSGYGIFWFFGFSSVSCVLGDC